MGYNPAKPMPKEPRAFVLEYLKRRRSASGAVMAGEGGFRIERLNPILAELVASECILIREAGTPRQYYQRLNATPRPTAQEELERLARRRAQTAAWREAKGEEYRETVRLEKKAMRAALRPPKPEPVPAPAMVPRLAVVKPTEPVSDDSDDELETPPMAFVGALAGHAVFTQPRFEEAFHQRNDIKGACKVVYVRWRSQFDLMVGWVQGNRGEAYIGSDPVKSVVAVDERSAIRWVAAEGIKHLRHGKMSTSRPWEMMTGVRMLGNDEMSATGMAG
jgi:hypothetical protein